MRWLGVVILLYTQGVRGSSPLPPTTTKSEPLWWTYGVCQKNWITVRITALPDHLIIPVGYGKFSGNCQWVIQEFRRRFRLVFHRC